MCFDFLKKNKTVPNINMPWLNLPLPPVKNKISGQALCAELRKVYPIGHIWPTDATYSLTSVEEYTKFLKLFQAYMDYTFDNYDCDKIAWEMRNEANKWLKGEFPFGWVGGFSEDENYFIPIHCFNLIIDYQLKIWVCDYLEVAGPAKEFMPIIKLTYLEDIII